MTLHTQEYPHALSFKELMVLLMILVMAATFRFGGLNWDQSSHVHPDERFLTMVTTNLSWPATPKEYLDTRTSPLNPHNRDFSFYVYGTYPVHVTKFVAGLLNRDTYEGVPLIGRMLSGIIDLFTVSVVFAITVYIGKNIRTGLLAAFFYGISVLPIQLSHFYTVDPYATLAITLALWSVVRKRFGLFLGIMLGLAAAAKISSLLLIPVVSVSFLFAWPWRVRTTEDARFRARLIGNALLCLLGFLITFRLTYPYLFDGWLLNPKVLDNWKQLSGFNDPASSFPPSLQWIGTASWKPFADLFVWGLGIPLGIVAAIGLSWAMIRIWKDRTYRYVLFPLVCWIVMLSEYESVQFTKPLRYLWPMYPALTVISALAVRNLLTRIRGTTVRRYVLFSICLVAIVWPIGFSAIYTRPNTRVSATRWIYAHIPSGSTIAWEHWDDPLPFNTGEFQASRYTQIQLPIFDPDDDAKRDKIIAVLDRSDYLILASNRTYGSIIQSKRFPLTTRFYTELFAGRLGFVRIAEFTSRPMIPLPIPPTCVHVFGFSYGSASRPVEQCTGRGLFIVDDYADETFTVYDHAKVLIFKKTSPSEYSSLR